MDRKSKIMSFKNFKTKYQNDSSYKNNVLDQLPFKYVYICDGYYQFVNDEVDLFKDIKTSSNKNIIVLTMDTFFERVIFQMDDPFLWSLHESSLEGEHFYFLDKDLYNALPEARQIISLLNSAKLDSNTEIFTKNPSKGFISFNVHQGMGRIIEKIDKEWPELQENGFNEFFNATSFEKKVIRLFLVYKFDNFNEDAYSIIEKDLKRKRQYIFENVSKDKVISSLKEIRKIWNEKI